MYFVALFIYNFVLLYGTRRLDIRCLEILSQDPVSTSGPEIRSRHPVSRDLVSTSGLSLDRNAAVRQGFFWAQESFCIRISVLFHFIFIRYQADLKEAFLSITTSTTDRYTGRYRGRHTRHTRCETKWNLMFKHVHAFSFFT